MYPLKPIDKQSIPRALLKAERYRLLNEPREAESICLDILAADPQNQEALVCMILSLTDLLESRQSGVNDVRALAAGLATEYDRHYYSGVIEERWAKALMHARHASKPVHEALLAAMKHFEQADAVAPEGNDDAVLRWNTCVRLLHRSNFTPESSADESPAVFDEDVPLR